MINPDRLTVKTGEALNDALALARRAGNPQVHDTHLLLALLDQNEGIVVPLLQKVGARVAALREQLLRETGRYPKQSGDGAQPTLSREVNKVFDQAEKEAKDLQDKYLSTEHLLLALADVSGTETKPMLTSQGATASALREALTAVRGAHRVTDQTPEDQ